MMIRLLIALLQTDEIRVIVQQLAMDEVSAIANLQHRHRLMIFKIFVQHSDGVVTSGIRLCQYVVRHDAQRYLVL